MRNTIKHIRWRIARHMKTSPVVLLHLAQFQDAELVSIVTKNANTPSLCLAQLATSENQFLLSRVARHPNTPAATLAALATAPSFLVRYYVAENSNTPTETLKRLAKTSVDQPIRNAARHALELRGVGCLWTYIVHSCPVS